MSMMTFTTMMTLMMTTKASEEASWQAAAGESGRTNNVCQAASSRHQMVPNMILGSRVIITVIVVPIIVISSVNVIHIIVTNIIVISNHHFHYLQWLILVTTFTPVTNSQGIKPYWPKFCDSWSLVFPKKENTYYFHLDCLVGPRCARVPFHKIAARLIHGGPTA